MTTTAFLGLKKPTDSEAIDVSVLNENADKIDAFAAGQISVSLMGANDESNPTYDTPTACTGILLTAVIASNTDAGLRIFSGTSGQIFMQARNSGGWLAWTQIVDLPE